MADTLKYEIAHDLLASQVFERFTAEEQALRKADRLLRDGFELHKELQAKGQAGRLLTKEEVGYLGPFLAALNPSGTLATYLDESMAAITEEEEAEKRRLQEEIERQKKEQERQRRLFIISVVAGAVMLGIAIFAGIQYVAANNAKKEAIRNEAIADSALNDLQVSQEAQRIANFQRFFERGRSRMEGGEYLAAIDALQAALQFDSTQLRTVDSLLAICQERADLSGKYERYIREGDQAFSNERYLAAIGHYLDARSLPLDEQKVQAAQIKVDNCINELLPLFREHVERANVFKNAGGCDNARQELRSARQILPYLTGKNTTGEKRTMADIESACPR